MPKFLAWLLITSGIAALVVYVVWKLEVPNGLSALIVMAIVMPIGILLRKKILGK